ncbi:MAG: beta-ketoacyl synthase N-terminal-like domain-containing protein [Deltaproteobacteria bacterium]|jgi:3-oxoacyl-[acyl-carrier-protein] synthase II
MSERVVISGVGMVTPLGIGKKAFSRRLFRGDSGISPITAFDTSQFLSRLGAEVYGFIPKDFISVKNLRRMDRISSMTAASARMATEDAGLGIDASNRDRVGIILGVSYGSTDVEAQLASILFTEGTRPILVPNMVINTPAGHTSIELGFIGALTPQSTTVRLRLRQPLPMRLPRLKTVAPMFFWPEARISFQNFSLQS